MLIELKKWDTARKADLMRICNQIDRGFLSDRIPYPYTEENAEQWLSMVSQREGRDGLFRAVCVEGTAVGTISIEQKADVYRVDAEIGYFLLEEARSRGVMTQAVAAMCALAFEALPLRRITGLVYGPNFASRRVLEKNGFVLEGMMHNAVRKGDQIYPLCIYGKQRNA